MHYSIHEHLILVVPQPPSPPCSHHESQVIYSVNQVSKQVKKQCINCNPLGNGRFVDKVTTSLDWQMVRFKIENVDKSVVSSNESILCMATRLKQPNDIPFHNEIIVISRELCVCKLYGCMRFVYGRTICH